MQVFLSYRRDHARWSARAVRQALEQHGIDVFMDVEDIDSGRFENVILNQIGLREHFIVLLTPETARDLGAKGDWVSKELDRALDLEKNVIPTLVDNASAEDISLTFPRRSELLELNFFRLPSDLFDQAITVLIERFLTQPKLQELRVRTAEEHYRVAADALGREEWEKAEIEFDKAVALRTRPEYFLGRGVAKSNLGRDDEALNDIDAAISLDPFAFELMQVKFDLLQRVDRLQDAINLMGNWKQQARRRAFTFGSRIIERLDHGDDIVTAVHFIPELGTLYGNLPLYNEVGTSLAVLIEHAPENIQTRLKAELDAWRAAHRGESD
jgi:tetratricopeptide (TPR) repeat protein